MKNQTKVYFCKMGLSSSSTLRAYMVSWGPNIQHIKVHHQHAKHQVLLHFCSLVYDATIGVYKQFKYHSPGECGITLHYKRHMKRSGETISNHRRVLSSSEFCGLHGYHL